MKNIFKLFAVLGLSAMMTVSCLDSNEINVDPNNPQEVPSNMLMNGTEKWIVDNIYDNWFSGRQCLVYAQYWAQRNYTEEDRYQIRESVNNSYFNYLYMGVGNLIKVEKLNTDEATAALNSAYGANCNQIAAAKILKCWLMGVITDTWGAVPYSDVAKLESDGQFYCKYDDQKSLYATLIAELQAAVAMIDEDEPAFTSGDTIYDGDASLWKKFGNSLICRFAIHISKVDPSWKSLIAKAVSSGVFESNDDSACYPYVSSGSDYCKFYEGYYVDGRNDFTIAKPLCDILKGQRDTLNNKQHPWEGTVDPRLAMYTTPSGGDYNGIPIGAPSADMSGIRSRTATPSWYGNPPAQLDPDFTIPLMTYAELQFILSEYNGFSNEEFQEGIAASIEYWADVTGSDVSSDEIDEYIAAVGDANAEKVAVQKYIDLFLNGTEAWTELRRTGYPEQLVRPGEKTFRYLIDAKDPSKGSRDINFEPLSEVKGDFIARVKYPTNESTLNGANWKDAVSKLKDGTNNYYSKMFWDVRTNAYDHPANK